LTMPARHEESSEAFAVLVKQGDEQTCFSAGSMFASPNVGGGTTQIYIPKGLSLTITSVTYMGVRKSAVVHVTSQAGRFPLCSVRNGETVSGLGLALVGPQEVVLDAHAMAGNTVCEDNGVSVIGSVSPALYDYQSPAIEKETAKDGANKATTKKRKLSNAEDNSTPADKEESKQHQHVDEKPSQANQDKGEATQQLSKRQRKKLAKKKEKELAEAVAFLNKHESKVDSHENKKSASKKTTSLMKERRLPSGVLVKDIIVGNGAPVKLGRKVSILYEGAFPSGKVFDRNKNRNAPLTFRQGTGEVIRGLEKGIEGMKVGGEREITIPPEQGYGKKGSGKVVPPNSTLVFSVQLVGLGG